MSTTFADMKALLEDSDMSGTQKSAFVDKWVDTLDFEAFSPDMMDQVYSYQDSLNLGNDDGYFKNILSDKYKMGNLTGLASTLMQAAALPSQLKAAKLQNQAMQHNLDTAREEQARRNKNISGFNAPRSAFV